MKALTQKTTKTARQLPALLACAQRLQALKKQIMATTKHIGQLGLNGYRAMISFAVAPVAYAFVQINREHGSRPESFIGSDWNSARNIRGGNSC